jgi:hypothetical protein
MKERPEHHFRNVGGSLFFHYGDQLLYGPSNQEELAFCFDSESGTLHKHGPLSAVKKWMNVTRDKLRGGGFDEMAEHLTIVSAPSEGEKAWDVELINRFIQNSSYIGLWYRQQMQNTETETSIPSMIYSEK